MVLGEAIRPPRFCSARPGPSPGLAEPGRGVVVSAEHPSLCPSNSLTGAPETRRGAQAYPRPPNGVGQRIHPAVHRRPVPLEADRDDPRDGGWGPPPSHMESPGRSPRPALKKAVAFAQTLCTWSAEAGKGSGAITVAYPLLIMSERRVHGTTRCFRHSLHSQPACRLPRPSVGRSSEADAFGSTLGVALDRQCQQ